MSSFTFDPGGTGPDLSRPAPLIVVRSSDGLGGMRSLPNVRCVSVRDREGEPASARFRYVLDTSGRADGPFPAGFEDLVPVDARGDFAVRQGDRLVVSAVREDGTSETVFDGFAGSAEVAMEGTAEAATFQALGVACRLWDAPLPGAKYRDADDPSGGTTTDTDLPVRFNPEDDARETIKNATPDGHDENGGNGNYPVFLDPSPSRENASDDKEDTEDKAESGDTRRAWTLGMAARYLLLVGNPDETYVKNPENEGIDPALQAIAPVDQSTVMDVADPSTYTASDIVVRDFDASNRPCMESLKGLIWPHGLRFRFRLEDGPGGTPTTTVALYRRDGLFGSDPKPLFLQAAGKALDPARTNLASLGAQRPTPRFNAVEIETDPVLYQVAVVLAPGFRIAATDADAASWKLFDRTNWLADEAGVEADRQKYRLFIFDECGDGHWDLKAGAWSTTPGDKVGPDFGTIFYPDKPASERKYTRRYRPGRNALLLEESGVPLASELAVSNDYAGPSPGIWDGSGTWQPISSEWRLLRTRLGFMVTSQQPNAWNMGTPPADDAKDKVGRHGTLNLVEKLASATVGTKRPYFRLTTVIRSDRGLDVHSDRRPASPTTYSYTARVDCRDHFRKEVEDKSSPYRAIPTESGQLVLRDDTAKAQAYADALRSSGERGEWTGTATIPRFTTAYSVGDRVSGVVGRSASFRTNAGSEAGEGDSYPVISGITWEFEGRQATTLELADASDTPTGP